MSKPILKSAPRSGATAQESPRAGSQTQISLSDIIERVSTETVKLTGTSKRNLTSIRNRLGLPCLDSTTEVCAALVVELLKLLDAEGCLSIQSPGGSRIKINVL